MSARVGIDPESDRWPALESNPEALTRFAASIGLPPRYEIQDILGFDEGLLALLSRPCLAVILLFPVHDYNHRPNAAPAQPPPPKPSVFYIRQTHQLSNACGTIALLHCLVNAQLRLGVEGPLKEYAERTSSFTPAQRGHALDKDEAIRAAHIARVADGQSRILPSDEVGHHYVAFVGVDGHLVELDGAFRDQPRWHGPLIGRGLIDGDVVESVIPVIKRDYFEHARDGAIDFSLLALVDISVPEIL